jgi:paraquat-inducible protein B
MSENNANTDQTPETVPQATVKARSRRFSIVWIVPIVALVIGAWLVYKAYTEKGPTITITFETASGLEAGKTKIKYKDVVVGQVEEITLSAGLDNVILRAELVKSAEDFLSENTRFWVVRARVAAGEVSGLDTLFSGAYIGIDPGKPGAPRRDFKGLEIPPVVTADLPGGHFILKSKTLGSLDIGSPVYFRRIRVGQVVSYALDPDTGTVTLKVFINDPYHKMVYRNTRFWNAGGLDVAIDASGIRVNTESFVTLMIGGISFDLMPNEAPGGAPQQDQEFKLYKSRENILEKTYVLKREFKLFFDGSVRGLKEGAPVEFRGIQIGQVLDIDLKYDADQKRVLIPVLIEVESDRFSTTEAAPEGEERKKLLNLMVKRGMRAQLKSGNLLTGQLLVDLDFHEQAPPATIDWEGDVPVIPTIPAPLEEMTTSLVQLMNKLERLPIEQIGNHLRDTTQGASRLVNSSELREAISALNNTAQQAEQMTTKLNAKLEPETEKAIKQLHSTLKQAQRTLEDVSGAVSQDSALYGELKRTLTELADAARSIRVMADYLERHPDALIKGKGTGQ